MLSKIDPNESISNPIQFIKEAFSPLELCIKKVAKDLEICLGVSNDKGNNFELIAPLNRSDSNGKLQIFGVENRSGVNNGPSRVFRKERKKWQSIKAPIEGFMGMFSMENGTNNKKVEVEAVRNGLKEKDEDRGEGTRMNQLLFAMTWSVLVNGLVQAIPTPFKSARKQIQTMDEDKGCLNSCTYDMGSKVSLEFNHRDSRDCHLDNGKHVSFACFIGFTLNQLVQNLRKLDQLLQEGNQKYCARLRTQSTSIWECRKVYVNGFLGNLNFARVRGVSSGIVEVASSMNEDGDDDCVSTGPTGSREETGGNSPQKPSSGILSIPLSNVEHLRSMLPTVSLPELVELLPPSGRSSQDHPDKKKLLSVQDFFRYTETEGMDYRTAQ